MTLQQLHACRTACMRHLHWISSFLCSNEVKARTWGLKAPFVLKETLVECPRGRSNRDLVTYLSLVLVQPLLGVVLRGQVGDKVQGGQSSLATRRDKDQHRLGWRVAADRCEKWKRTVVGRSHSLSLSLSPNLPCLVSGFSPSYKSTQKLLI